MIEKILKKKDEKEEENLEVKLTLLSSLNDIDNVIGVEKLAANIVPILVELSKDKKWRVRLGIIPYLPRLT